MEGEDITIEAVSDPSRHKVVRALVATLNERLALLTGSSGHANARLSDFDGPGSLFLLAMHGGEAVGCGGMRPISHDICEIKRMFSVRSRCGIGTALLKALETAARERGYLVARLETRRINVPAVEFYLSQDYAIIENYGIYRGRTEAICFEKKLTAGDDA